MRIPVLETGQSVQSLGSIYYKIVTKLGQGGNGSVYLVQATSGKNQGILFAMKFMGWIDNQRRVERFNEETRILIEHPHPALISYYDYGIFSNIPFIVTSYLPRTLRQEISKGIPIFKCLLYSCQLLSALQHIHQNNIIHRDIKPENIFLHEAQAYLGDFGIATTIDQNAYEESKISTQEEPYVVMPGRYRTPELLSYALQGGNIDRRTDVFQMGLVITEMFTGKNVQKPSKDIKDEIQMEAIPNIASLHFGANIFSQLKSMLEIDTNNRKEAKYYLDIFTTIFNEYIHNSLKLDSRFILA